MPTRSKEIWHRADFPLLCLARKLTRCVEVGVDTGSFSDIFMSRHWNLAYYLGVDPYESYWECPHSREADRGMAIAAYSKYAGRCTLAVTTGDEMARSIRDNEYGPLKNGNVDFVYLDAMHEYEPVKKDIETWWPLISDEGILAGHDYDETHPGVMRAVDEFEADKRVVVYTTPDQPGSWYAYKNKRLTFTRDRC